MMKRRLVFLISFFLAASALPGEQFAVFFSLKLESPEKSIFCYLAPGAQVKDSYDAVSGASKKHSTKAFSAYTHSNEKKIFPTALRNLFLFAVSPPSLIKDDALAVTQEEKELTVRFVHRGNAYEIKTDENGYIILAENCFMQENVAENKGGYFFPKAAFLKESYIEESGEDSANPGSLIDWEKLSLEKETLSADAAKRFEGRLKAKFSKGVLRVYGSLKRVDNLREKENKERIKDLFSFFKKKSGADEADAGQSEDSALPAETDGARQGEPPESDSEDAAESGETDESSSEASSEIQGIDSEKVDSFLKKLDSKW